MLGKINILFGKVIDISDSEMLYRCRILIDGYNNEISKDELPWYWQFGGISYLPEIDDVVPVLIFDNNFSTAFYGKKIDNLKSTLTSDDYENYLELFKRTIDDKNVEISYTKSNGIIINNSNSKIQLETDLLKLFVEKNSITISKDRIDIGDSAKEATILGDKGVDVLKNIISHQSNTINKLANLLTLIASSCSTPYTIPIGLVINTNLPTIIGELSTENAQISTQTTKIQSKKTFIE